MKPIYLVIIIMEWNEQNYIIIFPLQSPFIDVYSELGISKLKVLWCYKTLRLLLPEDYTSKCYFGIFTFYLSESRQMIFRNVWKKRGPLSLKSAFIHQQQTRAAKKEILIHLISSTKCRPCPEFFFCKLLVPELLSLTSSSLRIYLFL